jgi:transcriptional regulator with XRE-family HTH domain
VGRLRFRIKELREARGLTQVEVAKLVRVRQATINDLENGKPRRDTLRLIERLCTALEVEPDELFGWTDRRKRRRRQ